MKDDYLDLMMRVLLFSYFYPPLGGPGIQRPCKMVYYFRQGGWDVDVVSVKDIIFHSYDEDMQGECNENEVYRVRSLDPMSIFHYIRGKERNSSDKKIYFQTPEKYKRIIREIFPIDEKIGWLPFAYKMGVHLCSKNKYDALIATTGPFTSAVIAYLVSSRCRVPLVIDYRDAWTLHPYTRFLTPFHRRIARYWEEKILRKAGAVSVNSRYLQENIVREFGHSLKHKIHVMYNAWDERDFSQQISFPSQNDRVEFFYMGGFYGLQTPKYFITALEELYDEDRLPSDIKVTFVGNYFHEVSSLLQKSKIHRFINVIPQVPHKAVVERMLGADVLLLFAATFKGKGVIPGKLFEYLRSQKEILGMVPPDGESSEILKSYRHNTICAMEDVREIKKLFIELYNNRVIQKKCHRYPIPGKYSRRNQTRQFMNFLQKRLHKNEI